MTSQNFLTKAMEDFITNPPEDVFPKTDEKIDKSLDFALSLPEYLAALNKRDRSRVVGLMEFILNNPLPAYLKKLLILESADTTKRKNVRDLLKFKEYHPNYLPPKKKKSSKRKDTKIRTKVAGYVDYQNVDGTDHNIIIRLGADQIMNVRRGRFPFQRDPKIPVKENKAFECRESHSSYCGVRKTLKNWLYFV